MKAMTDSGSVLDFDDLELFKLTGTYIELAIKDLHIKEEDREDAQQECGLAFFGEAVKKYTPKDGCFFTYIRRVYLRTVAQMKEKNNICRLVNVELANLKSKQYYSYSIEDMEFASMLSGKQRNILQLILDGFNENELAQKIYGNTDGEVKSALLKELAIIRTKLKCYQEGN